jgi:nicotinate dehydrogenase subunit B
LLGGKKFNLRAGCQRQAQASERMDGARKARAASGPSRFGHGAQFEFVHNVRVPGMLHGAWCVRRRWAPRVVSVDEDSVKDMPGLVKVVVKKNFVGVVARKALAGDSGREQIESHVDSRRGTAQPGEFYDHLRTQPKRDTLLVDSGDVDKSSAERPRSLKATYLHPYQMHGSVGSSCAVADVQGEKATIWSPTQGSGIRRAPPRWCSDSSRKTCA